MAKPTLSESVYRKLPNSQRNMLINHIDGEVDVTVSDPHAVQSRNALIGLGLIRGSPAGALRPRATVLTESGRATVGMILGDYADALIRAGILEQHNPLDVLRQLKASRSGGHPTLAADRIFSDVPLPGSAD